MDIKLNSPELVEGEKQELQKGINIKLKIIYRPYAGNTLSLYDENLHLINDDFHFYHAKEIILTNVTREENGPIEGKLVLSQEVICRKLFNSKKMTLTFTVPESDYKFAIKDEYTMSILQFISFEKFTLVDIS